MITVLYEEPRSLRGFLQGILEEYPEEGEPVELTWNVVDALRTPEALSLVVPPDEAAAVQ